MFKSWSFMFIILPNFVWFKVKRSQRMCAKCSPAFHFVRISRPKSKKFAPIKKTPTAIYSIPKKGLQRLNTFRCFPKKNSLIFFIWAMRNDGRKFDIHNISALELWRARKKKTKKRICVCEFVTLKPMVFLYNGFQALVGRSLNG